MSASNSFETSLLGLIFRNVAITNIANASAASQLYISLHTADPGEAGNQSTNEATYTSYARIAVNRDVGNWTITNNEVTNAVDRIFPSSTGGTNTITHFGIGTGASGATTLLFSGALDTSLSVSNGITPLFQVGQLKITCD